MIAAEEKKETHLSVLAIHSYSQQPELTAVGEHLYVIHVETWIID